VTGARAGGANKFGNARFRGGQEIEQEFERSEDNGISDPFNLF
jgi:hypothetical protein